MEWITIAVIIAALIIIGALTAITKHYRKKRSKKSLFSKTYETIPSEAITAETNALSSEKNGAQAEDHSDSVETEEFKGGPIIPHGAAKEVRPESGAVKPIPKPSPKDLEPAVAQSIIEVAVQSNPLPMAASVDNESKSEISLSQAAIAEVEVKNELTANALPAKKKQPAQLITEIESEPAQAEKRSMKAPVAEATVESVEVESLETSKDAQASSLSQEGSIADRLNSTNLEDWITLSEEPLSSGEFQIISHKIAKAAYPRRKEPEMRAVFLNHAYRYLDYFDPTPPCDSISEYIYKCLAITLQEDHKIEDAIDLCKKAIDLGLDDGTKTGYIGRIERLNRSKNLKK